MVQRIVDDIHVYVDSRGVNLAGSNAGRARAELF